MDGIEACYNDEGSFSAVRTQLHYVESATDSSCPSHPPTDLPLLLPLTKIALRFRLSFHLRVLFGDQPRLQVRLF